MRTMKSALLLLPYLLAGCGLLAGPKPDRTRYYVLTPIAPSAAADSDLSLGLESLRMPDYLDGYDIITRVGANELRRNPLERWAEPLESSFKRALGQNLASLLHTDRVLTTSWYGKQQPLFTLRILVERFEPNSDGKANLIARWSLRRGTDDTAAVVRESHYECAIAGNSMNAAVDAMSNCLADLCREIAAAVESLR